MLPENARQTEPGIENHTSSESDCKAKPANDGAMDPVRAAASARTKRKVGFGILAAMLLAGALWYGVYWWLVGSHYVSTDDAYVDATPAQITPQVAACVSQVLVWNAQPVKAGQVLVVLDNSDARIAVERAQAQLAEIQRRVRGDFATDVRLGAQIAVQQARVIAAQANLDRARTDLGRRERLARSGAISQEDLTAARNRMRDATAALAEANAQLAAARAARAAQNALVAGSTVQTNPQVLAAQAQLTQARLNLKRTVIRAPVAGIVTNDTVQIGQRVQVGAFLMSVVPIDRAYVNANFKEVQLKNVRVGQPVTLVSDLYGGSVVYYGRVAGLAGGTGAAFSLIPAQNATGNWIKVVQRLPVRIQIDPSELRTHPLRVGLSMTATIDTASRG